MTQARRHHAAMTRILTSAEIDAWPPDALSDDSRTPPPTGTTADARVVSSSPLTLNSPEVEGKAGAIRFFSIAVRAFKLELEDRCEDVGQVATYLGSEPHHRHAFVLDDHHRFGNRPADAGLRHTADMLTRTRYAEHFRVSGDKSVHFGLFDCGPAALAQTSEAGAKNGAADERTRDRAGPRSGIEVRLRFDSARTRAGWCCPYSPSTTCSSISPTQPRPCTPVSPWCMAQMQNHLDQRVL